jgi:hypothetical protein
MIVRKLFNSVFQLIEVFVLGKAISKSKTPCVFRKKIRNSRLNFIFETQLMETFEIQYN